MQNISKVIIEVGPNELRQLIEDVVQGVMSTNGKTKRFDSLPKYLTRSQVAEVLRIHPNTVTLWEKSGKIKRDKEKGLECYLTTKILQILENRRDLGY